MRAIILVAIGLSVGCDLKDTTDTADIDTDTGADTTDTGSDCVPTAEVCDGEDNDCDGVIDNGVLSSYYTDGDGDGFGAGTTTEACEPPSGTVEDGTDCDDADANNFPGNVEVCDGLDNNCDDTVDEGVTTTYYPDVDADGFGDDSKPVDACTAPKGHTESGGDCNDIDASVNPKAPEYCDGVDNDCNEKTGESGTISFIDSAGKMSDVTADYTGTSTAGGLNNLGTPGMLQICEGTWYERFVINADVSIVGVGDPSLVVLWGDDTSSVITLSTSKLTAAIEGLTITGGYGDGLVLGSKSFTAGGGVYCAATSNLTIADTIIDGNAGSVGAGLYVEECTVDLSSVEISNNTASYVGGGMTITGGTVSMLDTLVEGNDATSLGGGILMGSYGSDAYLLMEGSLFTDNSAPSGGGAYLELSAAIECLGDTKTDAGFTANSATSTGGGVYLTSGSVDSDICDWGAASAKDDNTPDDIYPASSKAVNYGNDETFTCTELGCK